MSTPKISLYISPGSCSLAPHILLRESGLPFNLVNCSVRNGFPEEYRHLNPKGKVPFLQINPDGENTTITENPAIMTYLSHLAPKSHFFGTTPLEAVRCYEWLNYLSGTLHAQAFGGVFRPSRFHDDESTQEVISAKSLENVKACYEFVEEKLGERSEGAEWAVGNGFTVVDAYLYVFYRWGLMKEIEMKEKYPTYTALVRRVARRESVQEAVKEEGIPVVGL